MLTLFALPKPFLGHINVIQRNALNSWIRLVPSCQILLFGNEEGTSEIAHEFGIQHISYVAKNEFGTPLVNDLFSKAQQIAIFPIMCYVNSDIILMNDFMKAITIIDSWNSNFLAIGRSWNLKHENQLDFNQSDWCIRLHDLLLEKNCELREPWATEYFVFHRYFYQNLPPFALGRAYFDNWLIWKARSQKAFVVDITFYASVIHQLHDYSHVPGGILWAHRGDEAINNVKLSGGLSRRYCIFDATHYLLKSGIKRNFIHKLRWRMIKILKDRLWYYFLDKTRPVRSHLGLRMSSLKKLLNI